MLILPPFAYFAETEVCWLYQTAHFLPALRMGVVLDGSSRANKICPDSAGPYQLVVGFMKVKGGGLRRIHRCLYIHVGADPWQDDGSDNWVRPDSFRPREPMTLPPVTFDIGLGRMGTIRNEWTARIKDVKARWDRFYSALGINPPCSRTVLAKPTIPQRIEARVWAAAGRDSGSRFRRLSAKAGDKSGQQR